MNPTETRTRGGETAEIPARGDFLFDRPASEVDPTAWRLCELEQERQRRKIVLIASESVCPRPVREVLASSFNNLYAEGYPSWRLSEPRNRHWADFTTHLAYYRRYSNYRYYRGCEYADLVESIAQKRIALLFATEKVPADHIHANVQPLSGAAANNAVYQALVPLGAPVLGMSLVEGGHLTHGSPANRSGKNYRVFSYGVSPKTGRIDYDQVERLAREARPRLIIGGASAYPWHIDWERLRAIADEVGAYLLADVAHYAGLIVAGVYPNPIEHAHVVSFTTHKSLCGPRGAVLLTTDRTLARKLDVAVFPGEQGGPHVGNIAAKSVAFHLAGTDDFRRLMRRVVANAKALAAGLEARGLRIAYGGTESHLCLVDLNSIPSPTGYRLTGEIAGRLLDLAGVVVNKNTIRGDRSAVHPSAIRLGTVWASQLGFDEADMDELADLMARLLKGVHPFRYIESSGYVGRGKVDLDLLEEVRKGVDALVERRLGPPPEPVSGYPHFDAYPGEPPEPERVPPLEKSKEARVGLVRDALGVLEIESERAHYFLQSAATADLSRLSPGRAARTFFLDRKGRRLGDGLVVRQPDRIPGWRRYLVVTNAGEHRRLRRWFRALSDGYVLFEDEDVFRKLEGPAMVQDLTEPEPHAGRDLGFRVHSMCEGLPVRETPERLLCPLAVVGQGAADAVRAAFGRAPEPGEAIEVRAGASADPMLAVGDEDLCVLLPGEAEADAVVAAAAVEESGPDLLAAWRAAHRLPRAGEATAAADLLALRPDLFERRKVYFAGRDHVPPPEVSEKRDWSYEPPDLPLRRTPLYERHLERAGKNALVPFAGWEMPVRYTSILEEHRAVRERAGLFDVSHMGVLEVRGDSAQRFLDAVTTNYVAWLRDGECQYSYLLDPDGRCLDDILVYRRAHDRILLVVNAANAEKDLAWLRAVASREVVIDRKRPWIEAEGPPEIVDLKSEEAGEDRRVDLALQGPRSLDVLSAAIRDRDLVERIRRLKRFEFVEGRIGDIEAMICTTGYTGEKVGFEILVHPDRLVELWDLLLEKGEPFGLAPCGLGARDSTRIEAGFPLWGHELAGPYEVTPIEAGYGSAVKFHKPFFVGRDAMRRHEENREREIVRFEIEGKGRLVREGAPVATGDGKVVGVVTSSTQVGDRQVGLALVDRRSSTRGTHLYVYRLPPDARRLPEPRPWNELRPGDQVLLPQRATIVRRFL